MSLDPGNAATTFRETRLKRLKGPNDWSGARKRGPLALTTLHVEAESVL